MPTKKATPPRAAYAAKEPTELIIQFCRYLTEQTGYEVDPLSVYLGSALRGDFQKSPENQSRLAEQAERIAAEKVAREQRKADRAAKAAAPKVEKPKRTAAPARTKAAPAPQRRRPLPTPKAEVE